MTAKKNVKKSVEKAPKSRPQRVKAQEASKTPETVNEQPVSFRNVNGRRIVQTAENPG